MKRSEITLFVNKEAHALTVAPNQTLLQVLREELDLTGTKYGCGTGECGSCTVLLDGEPILACLTLAMLMDGRRITTIEGLEEDGQLHPVQEAFVEKSAIQCGFCTPGMVLKSKALLDKNPSPRPEEIQAQLEGNICRCTGYVKIIEAVEHCAAQTAKK